MEILLNIEKKEISGKALKIISAIYEYRKISDKLEKENVSTIYCRFSKKLTRDFLIQFSNLRSIVCNATDVSHIDEEYCMQENITILSLRNEKSFLAKNVTSSAELTWCLILMAARRMKEILFDLLKGNFDRDKNIGTQLKDKKIVLIGLGRNGEQIARFAEAFQMEVSYYDPHINRSRNYKRWKNLEEALKNKDFIVLSLTSNSETKCLISSDVLQKLSGSPILINSSRGEIVDESAIIEALENKKIQIYATDVISDEQNFRENIIFRNKERSDLILLPHVGGVTEDAWHLTETYLFKKLLGMHQKKV